MQEFIFKRIDNGTFSVIEYRGDEADVVIPPVHAGKDVTELKLPDGIRTIAPYTFKDCRELKRIICNPGLREIKARAFEGCDPDMEIINEKSLEISPRAFACAKNE